MQELILTLEHPLLLLELREAGILEVKLFSLLGNVAIVTVPDDYDTAKLESLPGVLAIERSGARIGRFFEGADSHAQVAPI